MTLKRKLPTLTQWHRWLGLTLSLWFLLMAVSGSILLYKNEYLSWQYPQLQLAEPVTQQQAAEILDHHHTGYALMPTHDRPWLEIVDANKTHYYYDATGRLLLERTYLGDLTSWLVELHHSLVLDELGKDILGILGIAGLLLIVTGLVRWWPRQGFSLRALTVRFYNPLSRRGMQTLWQSHRFIGVVLFIPIFIGLSTGTAIMYSAPVKSFLVTVLPFQSQNNQPHQLIGELNAKNWQQRLDIARQALPTTDARLLYLEQPRIRLKHQNEWHPNGRNYVNFSDTGTLSEVTNTRHTPLGNQVSNTIYPLHVAAMGGWFYQLVILLSGIALILLPITGIWFYVKRWQRTMR